MRKKFWVFPCILISQFYLVCMTEADVAAREKVEAAATPVTTSSPPEGNTTFLGGTSWCVAQAGVPERDLQTALDWACGLGSVDCKAIQSDGPCFVPDTLLSHASYAFNSYYQQNGNNDVACNFGGTASLTKSNPSYGKCVYAASGSAASSAPPQAEYKSRYVWLKFTVISFILLYLRS